MGNRDHLPPVEEQIHPESQHGHVGEVYVPFCLAVLYYNMWLASNSLKAAEANEPVKDDQGRYQITAHRCMMSLLNDFGSVSIGEVDDLSEKSEMVEAVFEDAG